MYVSGQDQGFSVWGFIKGFGKLLIGLLLLLQGIIGLALLILVIGVFISISNGLAGGAGRPVAAVPPGSALLINPQGVLVEQAESQDPFQKALEEAYGVRKPSQVEAGQIIHAIRKARSDDRITGLVLDLGGLRVSSSSASKLHDIAAEVAAFRGAGKPVIAVGDYYSQEQYLLAANADEILLHDFGNVVLYGYGSYNTYVKSFLEKFKVTSHVFRVGAYKEAVEPFLRDDMSDEAKEANLAYLNVLWDDYVRAVERARNLPQGSVRRYADEMRSLLANAKGDFARTALDAGLVDSVKSRSAQIEHLKGKFGADKDRKSFKHVTLSGYVAATGVSSISDMSDQPASSANHIAVVTAAGVIVDGEAQQGSGAGGDTIAALLKKAREDDKVKAVVLRIDSPGGSSFASEIIREEVLALQAAGKPVVASMGSLAASGGYWIAAPADEIWAAPTTITGSIGIFGFFTTFENTAAEVGVHVDGVGTTSLSSLLATGIGPLPEEAADIIQQSTEEGYERFLRVVGEGRGLDRDYVDSIGQGRVWIARTALELKLVDKLGGLDEAIASAATLAKVEDYKVVDMVEKLTPFQRLFGRMSAEAFKAAGVVAPHGRGAALAALMEKADEQIAFFSGFNDPNGVYARCLACEGGR